jgi:hypothetical protein
LAEELGVPLNVHLHESPADPTTGQLDALRRVAALRHVSLPAGCGADGHSRRRRSARPGGSNWFADAGKQADLQVINPAELDFAPHFDWVSQLVFNGQPANVEWVFVAGRALKRDGWVIGDQARVIADAQAASDRIQKLLRRNPR